MIEIHISDQFKSICPNFKGGYLSAQVTNSLFDQTLWMQIEQEIWHYQNTYSISDIKNDPMIAATRRAYKLLGKDPNRYRPSAESLCRRIVRGLPLYRINTLVDIINLVSIHTGYSIGGFDVDKIKGNINLAIGQPDEPYEGIGKGSLNIDRLPVYRDSLGGIGTPTSDNERTKISLETTSLLVIFNSYSGASGLEDALLYIQELIQNFAMAKNIQIKYF